jgi:hypothetical protein
LRQESETASNVAVVSLHFVVINVVPPSVLMGKGDLVSRAVDPILLFSDTRDKDTNQGVTF